MITKSIGVCCHILLSTIMLLTGFPRGPFNPWGPADPSGPRSPGRPSVPLDPAVPGVPWTN